MVLCVAGWSLVWQRGPGGVVKWHVHQLKQQKTRRLMQALILEPAAEEESWQVPGRIHTGSATLDPQCHLYHQLQGSRNGQEEGGKNRRVGV